ncbi:hypothetical protein CLOP_g4524 [Closterium sp. NIES-67]|nr:hypothetical protein CLOP_g4524 [Closterium sp. NIES-67]
MDAGMGACLPKPIDPALIAHMLLTLMVKYPHCCVQQSESIEESGAEGESTADGAATRGAAVSAAGERPVSSAAAAAVAMAMQP